MQWLVIMELSRFIIPSNDVFLNVIRHQSQERRKGRKGEEVIPSPTSDALSEDCLRDRLSSLCYSKLHHKSQHPINHIVYLHTQIVEISLVKIPCLALSIY